ncbi:MAG: C10 family peptidase [Lentisphaeria bacterium]|nr:C10 family peptidase [Lentisphaeria bacterium]
MTEYEVKSNSEYAAGNNAGNVLTTTLWNQSGEIYVKIDGTQTRLGVDYNIYCPIYNGSDRAVTGCTNTADAQIIYYWLTKGYADQITLTANADDWFRVGKYSPSDNSGHIEFGTADEQYGVLSVDELNGILSNADIVPQAGESWNGNKTELGNFIAALNFYCGIKNNSDYYSTTATWFYVSGAYYDGTDADVYAASGFDSYYRVAFSDSGVGADWYNVSTDRFTDLGHSILQENLDYGEVIRVDIPGHSIYMDGYRETASGEYEYHLNYGWGVYSSSTSWYTEAEIAEIGINGITIDLSPDINVVVSNTESEYWGGSFERGMERVNHIQTTRTGDDAVDFVFADDIGGKDVVIERSVTTTITSKCDVNFSNINVDLYFSSNIAFSSGKAMSFDLDGGSIIVNSDSANNSAIKMTANQVLTVTLENSFIYSGYNAGGYDIINGTLDIDGGYYYNNLNTFAATVKGSVMTAGSADDAVVLKNNSALFGDLNLGSGSNTLTVESGSIFYGGFSGSNLTVNLTINSADTGAMLVMTSTGESAFLTATNSLLNVTVDTNNIAGGAYTLYAGTQIENIKINLTIGDKSYGTLQMGDTISNEDYKLVYNAASGEIKLAYSIAPATVDSINSEPTKELDEDGLTNGDVIVTAEFSENTTEKWYKIGENGTWQLYEDSGVRVTENAIVYFKAVNAAHEESEILSTEITCIDKTPPPALEITPSETEWTNRNVTSTADFPANTTVPDDFTYIKYSIDGGKTWQDYTIGVSVVEFESNATVIFRAYDKRDNYKESRYDVTNIDKVKPDFTADSIIGSGEEEVRFARVDYDLNKSGNSSDITHLQYSLNGSDWYDYTAEVLFGENCKVYFRAVDRAGNISENVVEYEITNVDSTPPATPEVSADITQMTNKEVTVTAVFNSDDVVNIEYSLDGKSWNICKNYTVNGNNWVFEYKTGKNCTLYFRSKDNVGNVSEVVIYDVNNIDTTPPEVPVIEVSETALTNKDVIVTVKFDEVSTDIVSNQYSFTGNKDDWHDYTGELVIEKNCKIYVRSIDHVGNVSGSEYEVTNIDKTAPAVPVIISDNDGRITHKPINVWADFGLRRVEKMEYSLDGTDWFAFDPDKAVNAGSQGVISLRAYDKAGNVSEVESVELTKGMVTEMPEWQWNNTDAITLEYSLTGNDNDWAEYTGDEKIFESNGKIYFRAKDEAGNISNVKEYRIDNIDDIADDDSKTKIYIDKNYTQKNTFGKFVDGDRLDWEVNAFTSIAHAGEKGIDLNDDSLQIVGGALTDEDIKALEGVKLLSAVTVVPEGSYTGSDYSYNTKGKSAKKITIAGKDYRELDLEWFNNVSLSKSTVKDIAGGNSEILSSQRYSKDGNTLTRQTTNGKSASGFVEISKGSNAGNVSGYLTVEIADSTVGTLEGGQKSVANTSKMTNSEKLYQLNISLKESSSASGSADLKRGSEVSNIENYKNVNLQWATVTGVISSSKEDFTKSENLVNTGKKFTRNITVKQTLDSDGSLQVDNSSVGSICGYSNVVLNSAVVENISRQADDGGAYRKQNDSWSISLDSKSGKVNGYLTESMNFINSGKLSVAGMKSDVESIKNFSNVTVFDSKVGDISNNVLVKDEKKYLYIWDDIDIYGEQQDYTVDTEKADRVVVLKSVEKSAANGSVTIQNNSSVGDISGYDKVVLTGNGSVDSIDAVSGSKEVVYTDTTQNKNDVAASGAITRSITEKPATSVKIDGYEVTNGISGYKTVTAGKAKIGGDIKLGSAYTGKTVTAFSTKAGIVTKTYSQTTTYTNNGSVSLKDSDVTGDISNYAKVVLDKSSAGDIVNNTMVKDAVKYSETWDALDLQIDPENTILLEDFIYAPVATTNKLSEQSQEAANGSIELKNNSTAGNISGYNTVKLTGNAEDGLSVGYIKATDNAYGSYKYDYKKASDKGGKSAKVTENIAVAPAASVTVAGYNVTGNITGYKTVKLTDTVVDGNVDLGGNYTAKAVTTYSGNRSNIEEIITYKPAGVLNGQDISVRDINNYNKVELKNSVVGDIYQSYIVKEVKTWEDNKQISCDSTVKLSGTVTLNETSAGNITNYQSVVFNNGKAEMLNNVANVKVSGLFNSISSLIATGSNDGITVNKKSVLNIENAVDFGEGTKDTLTVNGTLVLGDSFQTLAGVDKLAGKGVIAANSDVWAKLGSDLDGFAGTRLDLGNTAAGFRGVEFEAADNAAATAFEWDGETTYTGRLGIGDDVDFADDVDYIRLVAEKESTLTIASSAWENGTGDIVRISGGNEIEITDGSLTYELVAGGEYIIEITRKDKDSMSYTMSIA